MNPSEIAREQQLQHQTSLERKLVDGDDPASAGDGERGFDRKRQGAPRADDRHGGSISTYGTGTGSEYSIDNESDRKAGAEAKLSNAGYAPGAAGASTEVGQYAGDYGPSDADPPSDPHGQTQQQQRAAATSHDAEQPGPRSDRQLHGEIAEGLRQRSDVEMRDVSVLVHDGKVTLEGSVPERRFKEIIEAVTDNVAGVVDVDNRLTVRRLEDEAATFASGYTSGQSYAASIANPVAPAEAGPTSFGAASGKAKEDQAKQGEGE